MIVFLLYMYVIKGDNTMIENEVKTKTNVKTSATSSNTTSPISRAYQKSTSAKSNAFLAWLNDEDTVEEKQGKVSAKTAIISFAKGLIEIVKTLYKKPVLSILTIATGVALTYLAKFSALAAVMSLSIVAGSVGIIYAAVNIATAKTSITTKQAYEVLGISTFVLGLGIYGLLI